MILKFPRSFFEYSSNLFFKISTNITTQKVIPFSNFRCTFSAVPRFFIDILSSFFCKFLKFFFKDFFSVSIKLYLRFAQIFILVYLKIFLQVSEVI